MDYPEKRERKSTVVRIPRGLKEEIEIFLLTDVAKKAGYDDQKAVVEAYREKYREELEIRGVNSNSGAVLFILTKVMEAEGLLDEFDVKV